MALGASVYKLIFDTQGLNNVVASRRELALQKKIMEETTPVVDKLAIAEANLDRLVGKGLLNQEQRNQALELVTEELTGSTDATAAASEAEADRARILQNTNDILAGLQTKEQAFAETRANAWEALQAGLISESEYQQVLAQSPKVLAAEAAAEKERAAALKEGTAAVRAYEDERKHGLALNKEFMPASEAARQKLVELKAAYAAGHVSQSSYNNGLIQLTATQMTGIPVVGKMVSTIASIGPLGVVVAGATAGIAAGIAAISAAASYASDKITEQISKIDKLTEASDTIGIPVGQFQSLSHAADLANISQTDFASGTEKMLVNISKGADGSKKLVDAFNLIGLDARKLRDVQPEQAFSQITSALDRVPNSADKARAATAIFGSADFLRIDTSHIDRATSLMERLRGGIDDVDASVFGEFDANTKDLNAALDVTWQKLAMEIVPALGDAAAVATEWLVGVNQSETFTATLQGIGDALSVIVATSREMPGAIESWMPSLETASTLLKQISPTADLAGRAGFAAGGAAGSSTSDLTEQVRRQRELDAQLRERQDSGKPIVTDDDIDSVSGMTKELEKQVKQLEETAEYAGYTKEEIILLKLAEAGASAETRDAATASVSRIMQLEREEKAAKELAQANEEAAAKAEAAEKKRQDAINGTIEGLDDQLRKLQLSEREQLEHSLAVQNASESEKAAALRKFDSIKALEKERDATKLATDAITELEKQIRQSGMSAEEKKIDDLKAAGVSDEQLKIIDSLQKELALRSDIKSTIEATSGAIKAGSREAADVFAKANQSAVLARFNRDRRAAGAGAPVQPEPLGIGVQGSTVTPPAVPPTISGATSSPQAMIATQAKEQLKETQKTNTILSQINEKTVPLQIEEVTL